MFRKGAHEATSGKAINSLQPKQLPFLDATTYRVLGLIDIQSAVCLTITYALSQMWMPRRSSDRFSFFPGRGRDPATAAVFEVRSPVYYV